MARMDEFTLAYFEAALFSTNDESDESGGEPLDANYGIEDFAPETSEKMIADCADFQERFDHLIESGGGDWGRAGHDFWLTRNRHGAGFWDGDWPEPQATELTKAAEEYGEFYLSVYDGLIYALGYDAPSAQEGRPVSDRLFMGVYPTGIVYADKSREKDGDYARCAFLSFSTLELKWEKDCPGDLRAEIERDAKRIQSMRGQPYPIDASGNTVILGGRPHAREAPRRHMRAPREQHVVNDFNTIDDLVDHAERELGATHVLIAGPETRLYFPRGGQYPYEEARVWHQARYWHAEGRGARSAVSHLPPEAHPITSSGRRAAEESGGFLVDKFYLVDRVTGGTLGGPFDTRREANREKRSKSFEHDLYIWQAKRSGDTPPHAHAASRPGG